MNKLISIPKGSRVSYRDDSGEERTGTVHEIDRRKESRKIGGTVYVSIYLIAETGDEITKDQIIKAHTPQSLKKDVLASLLDEDILENIRRSEAAVIETSNKYGFRPSKRESVSA